MMKDIENQIIRCIEWNEDDFKLTFGVALRRLLSAFSNLYRADL